METSIIKFDTIKLKTGKSINIKRETAIYDSRGEANSERITIDGNGKKLTKTDVDSLHKELASIFNSSYNIDDIKLENIDMSNVSIPKLLKDSPTCNIEFSGSSQYMENLKNKKVHISKEAQNSILFLDTNSNQNVSEYDLFTCLKASQGLNVYPSITVDDAETILKYTDPSKIFINAKTQEELDKISNKFKDTNVLVKINSNDIHSISHTPENCKINVYTPNVASFNYDDINKLSSKNINIDNIVIPTNYDINIPLNFNIYNYDNNTQNLFYGSDVYNIDTYKKIAQQLNEITNGINPNSPDIEKFIKVYQRVGKNINYDFQHTEEVKSIYRWLSI